MAPLLPTPQTPFFGANTDTSPWLLCPLCQLLLPVAFLRTPGTRAARPEETTAPFSSLLHIQRCHFRDAAAQTSPGAREIWEIHFSAPLQGAEAPHSTPAHLILSLREGLVAEIWILTRDLELSSLTSSQFHTPSALALEQKGNAQQELLCAFLAGGFFN